MLADWSIPGEHRGASAYDMARTVCRRAERALVRLQEDGVEVQSTILSYINRLSDLLWLFGRKLEHDAGVNGSLREATGKKGNRFSRAWCMNWASRLLSSCPRRRLRTGCSRRTYTARARAGACRGYVNDHAVVVVLTDGHANVPRQSDDASADALAEAMHATRLRLADLGQSDIIRLIRDAS